MVAGEWEGRNVDGERLAVDFVFDLAEGIPSGFFKK